MNTKQNLKDIKLINIPLGINKGNQTICLTSKSLGKGVFGTVFFAYDYNDSTNVFAVKTIDRK
jgi:hypothetical protein